MFEVIAYVSATDGDLYTGCLSHQNAKQQDPNIMITAADEIAINFQTSCSKEEAVAKLLGWMQGAVRHKYIQVTASGIPADQLPHLHTLDGSVEDQLFELREAAYFELNKAFDADAAPDIMKQKESVVTHWHNEIEKAAKYRCDIDDELANGKDSVLKLDIEASKETGNPQIMLSSLDRWAQTKYKIFIFATDPDHQTIASGIMAKTEPSDVEDASQLRPDVGQVKTNNLYVLLAFFVEAFAATASHYRENDEPNAKEIAMHFEAVVTAANNKNMLTGHAWENIRKVIAEAMLRKAQKQLKKSYVNGVLQPIVLPEP